MRGNDPPNLLTREERGENVLKGPEATFIKWIGAGNRSASQSKSFSIRNNLGSGASFDNHASCLLMHPSHLTNFSF